MSDEETTTYECEYCCVVFDDEDDAAACCAHECEVCGERFDEDYQAMECCPQYECGECGEMHYSEDSADECCASSGFGHSTVAPWNLNGIIDHTGHSDSSTEAVKEWGIDDKINPTQEAANYYLLEIITNDILKAANGRGFPSPETVWNMHDLFGISIQDVESMGSDFDDFRVLMTEASTALVQQVIDIEPMMLNYCQMAIGGELRHHQAVGRISIGSRNERSAAWRDWKPLVEQVGHEIYQHAAELFREFNDGSYGGNAWAVPSEIVYMRLTGELGPTDFMNRKLFLDRVWTLEHNGGCFLNKLGWELRSMQYVLNAHAADEPDYEVLFGNASDRVQSLFSRYVMHAKEVGVEIDFDPDWLVREHTFCSSCFHMKEDGTHGKGCSLDGGWRTKKGIEIQHLKHSPQYPLYNADLQLDPDVFDDGYTMDELRIFMEISGNWAFRKASIVDVLNGKYDYYNDIWKLMLEERANHYYMKSKICPIAFKLIIDNPDIYSGGPFIHINNFTYEQLAKVDDPVAHIFNNTNAFGKVTTV